MYRQKLVHAIRTEYEQIVSQIQSDNFEALSFANEIVSWPSEIQLCYPVFNPCSSGDVVVEASDTIPSSHCQHDMCSSLSAEGISLLNDRDSLLKLRKKLAMELLWLKQAIASRQKVKIQWSQ